MQGAIPLQELEKQGSLRSHSFCPMMAFKKKKLPSNTPLCACSTFLSILWLRDILMLLLKDVLHLFVHGGHV